MGTNDVGMQCQIDLGDDAELTAVAFRDGGGRSLRLRTVVDLTNKERMQGWT